MKHNFTLLLSLTIMSFSISLSAQENIKVETFQRPYVPLENGVNLTEGQSWNDPDIVLPLALRSEFFNSDTNTYIYSLGEGAEVLLLTQQDEIKWFAAVNFDLMDRGYYDFTNLSPISAGISGVAGDRILKLEWANAGFAREYDVQLIRVC
ncbi:MAG: hypothetical protein IPM42_12465 [Saprospiraceae bacterium]|nr:hypothetical protein [Saprospiraceae bacterium]